MINWDGISELQAEVGEDGIAEVVEIFLEEMEEGLEGLSASTETPEMLDKLHFLKGSAQNIGLDEVSSLCARDEAALKADATGQVDFQAIKAALSQAKEELSALTA